MQKEEVRVGEFMRMAEAVRVLDTQHEGPGSGGNDQPPRRKKFGEGLSLHGMLSFATTGFNGGVMTLKLVPRQVARGFACLAKSDVLYHATSLANALSILREDRLRLVSVNEVEERQLGRADVFWVSMARTKTSSYLVNLLGQAAARAWSSR